MCICVYVYLCVFPRMYLCVCLSVPLFVFVHEYMNLYVCLCLTMLTQVSRYVHIKSSFPKRFKRHSRKWACNANFKFKDCVLVKSFSHVYICVYIYEKFFSKTWSRKLTLASRHRFLDWRLTHFGKELFIWIWICSIIYIYRHMYIYSYCICIFVLTYVYIYIYTYVNTKHSVMYLMLWAFAEINIMIYFKLVWGKLEQVDLILQINPRYQCTTI